MRTRNNAWERLAMVVAGTKEGVNDLGIPFGDVRGAGGGVSEDVVTIAVTACAKAGASSRHPCDLTHCHG